MAFTTDEGLVVADLLTPAELEVWVEEKPLANPTKAAQIISAASLQVMEAAEHPEWTATTAPGRARLIAIQLAKRTYLNPNAEQSYTLGPIGARTIEDFARTLELTPYELEVLHSYHPDGGPGADAAGRVWTISTTNRPVTFAQPVVLNDTSGSGILYDDNQLFDNAYGPDPV